MKISIIGCGNMGKALAMRLKSHTLFLYDLHSEKMQALKEYGKPCDEDSITAALQESDVIILAVKPQGLDEAVLIFEGIDLKKKMLISLLTGISIARIKEKIPMENIVRMMPNLPMVYGEGLIGLSGEKTLLDGDQLKEICKPLGKTYFLDESKMDAFTSLAGSGPGFVLALIKSMINAGTELGFDAKDADFLVQQMVKGTVCLLEESGKAPSELIEQIATPNGTTIAGLNQYEKSKVNLGVIDTFRAAYTRATEM